MALLKCNRLKEAQEVFEFVRSENPNFEKVYANYGYLYTILGEFDLALIMYEKGIALNPDIVQLWMNWLLIICIFKTLRVRRTHCHKCSELNQTIKEHNNY